MNKNVNKVQNSIEFESFLRENPNAEMLPHTIKKNMLKTNCNRIE